MDQGPLRSRSAQRKHAPARRAPTNPVSRPPSHLYKPADRLRRAPEAHPGAGGPGTSIHPSYSMVARARNHRNGLVSPSRWTSSSCRSRRDLVPEASHSPRCVGRRESHWSLVGMWESGRVFRGPGPVAVGTEPEPKGQLPVRTRVHVRHAPSQLRLAVISCVGSVCPNNGELSWPQDRSA